MFYRTKDEKIMTVKEIREAYPATIFPRDLKPEHVASKGIVWVEPEKKPTVTNLQNLEVGEITESDGTYTHSWKVTEKPQAEKDRITASEAARQAIEQAKTDLAAIKIESKTLSMANLLERIEKIETILGL